MERGKNPTAETDGKKKSQRIVAKMYGWILREAKVGTFSEKLDQGRKLVYVHLNSRFWGSCLAPHIKRCLKCPSYSIPEGLNSSQSQLLLIQFPANAERHQLRDQMLVSSSPIWETVIEFQAPGFQPTQPWLLQAFRG